MIAILGALLLAGVSHARVTRTTFSFPEEVAGYQRLHAGPAVEFERWIDEWSSEEFRLEGAVYGTGNEIQLMIATLEARTDQSVDEIYTVVSGTMTRGVTSVSGGTNPSLRGSDDDRSFACGPLGTLALCVWKGSGNSGFMAMPGAAPAELRRRLAWIIDQLRE